MIKDALLEAVFGIWPMIVIFTVILTSFRITFLVYKKEKVILYKEITLLLFLVYILILFYIVTFQDTNYGFSNLIPFSEIFKYNIGSRVFFKNIVGNVLLFMPLGLFVSYYLNAKKYIPVVSVALISSLAIEITQLSIGRIFDIDDILLNVFGSFLGYCSFRVIMFFKNMLPAFLKQEWFINLVIILFVLVLFLYFTNFHNVIFRMVN